MKIKKIKIYPKIHQSFSNLETSSFNHSDRDSWIIEIINTDNIKGYGEASPLPNFNNETYEESGYALEGFKLALSGITNIEKEEIFILAKVHTINTPSACFAIETALYDLLAKENNLPMNLYLNSNASPKISVNGIYNLSEVKKYNILKIKCGFRNLYNEIELIESIVDKYGKSTKLIIDLNESYDLVKAIRFFKEVAKYNIEYIEQPIKQDNIEDLLELSFHTDIPIALDEAIKNIDSIENLLKLNCGDIFIIKPQTFGSFLDINQAFKIIKEANKIPVMTSSLEGIIGRLSTMHIASANLINTACGLGFDTIYKDEQKYIPNVIESKVEIPDTIGLGYK